MKKIVLKAIRFYHLFLSNILDQIVFLKTGCRFTPSCSNYAYQAVEQYGIFKGMILAFFRLAKCHPFNKGGYDPI